MATWYCLADNPVKIAPPALPPTKVSTRTKLSCNFRPTTTSSSSGNGVTAFRPNSRRLKDSLGGKSGIRALHYLTNLRDSSVETQSIVILDFGSQYTQLIARRIREQNVFSVVLPCTASLDEIRSYSPIGIILSGGPSSVYDADAPQADARVLEIGKPVLGICYGLHFMVHALGGKVRPGSKREYGHATVEKTADSQLLEGLPKVLAVWMSHGDEAEQLPEDFTDGTFSQRTRWNPKS